MAAVHGHGLEPTSGWPAVYRPTGWHIYLDVLDHLLSETPLGRIVGSEAMQFGWPRLNAEYARQFDLETNNPPQTGQAS